MPPQGILSPNLCRWQEKSGVPSLVIDTEQDFIKLGVARDVAAAMGAQYYTLQGLTKEKLLRIVRRAGRPAGR